MRDLIKEMADNLSAEIRKEETEIKSSEATIEEMIKKYYQLGGGRVVKYCYQPRYKGNDGKMHFGGVKPLAWEKFMEISSDPRLQMWQDEIRLLREKYPDGGDDYEAEKKLLKGNFDLQTTHALGFVGDMHRTDMNALCNRKYMFDCDRFSARHNENVREWLQQKLTPDFIVENGIDYAHISVSGDGFHIVGNLRKGETISGGQLRMARALGLADDEYDTGTYEPSRGSYIVHKSYWVVAPKEENWYFTTIEEALAAIEEGKKVLSYANNNIPKANDNTQHQSLVFSGAAPEYYKDAKISHIVTSLISRLGGEPEKGKRHDFYNVLCVNMRNVVSNNPQWLLEILPRWNDDEEQYSQCEYYCQQPHNSTIPPVVSAAIDEAKEMTKRDKYDFNSLPMPPLNVLQKILLSRIPQQYHRQFLLVEPAIIGALLHHCDYDYINGEKRRFVFGTTVVGAPASGKSFYKSAVELLKAPLFGHDMEQKALADDYKQQLKAAKNKGQQPVDPKTYLANLVADTTLAKLAYYVENAAGDTMYMQCDEIDELTRTESSKISTKKVIFRFSFDGNEWGQDRVGVDSVTAKGPVRICNLWNGTPNAVTRFFDTKEIEDGLASRQIFCLMPGFDLYDIPKFKEYSRQQSDAIRNWAFELYSTVGHFNAPWVNEAIEKWMQDKKLEYAAENEYFMQYIIRAAEYGVKAGVAYCIIDGSALKSDRSKRKGSQKEKNAVEYALWFAESVFRNAMMLFSDKIRRLSSTSVISQYNNGKYNRGRLYMDLPTTFTVDDIDFLQDKHNWHAARANILYVWRENGMVVRNDDGSYTKIK